MTRVEIPDHDIVGIRAANPGPFTLSGTNSWMSMARLASASSAFSSSSVKVT